MAMSCINGSRECDGCMACQEEVNYKCPVCGEELGCLEDVFVDGSGEVVGCEHCLKKVEAGEVLKND